MVESLGKSTPISEESRQNFDTSSPPERATVTLGGVHNPPSKVTARHFCSFDGGTTYRVILQQIRGKDTFRAAVLYARDGYAVDSRPTLLPEEFGYGDDVGVRKAVSRELSYLKTEDRPPFGDVFCFPEFRIVFTSFIADGLFYGKLAHAVVIFGWRMFERVKTLSAASKIVDDCLSVLGFRIMRYSLRRVDFNITCTDVSMDMIGDAYRELRIATKCRNCRPWDGKPGELETLYIGKSGMAVQFRAYDKIKELKALSSSEDGREKAVAVYSRLGVDTVSHISRLEFEVNADFLKDFEISTFEELEMKMKSVIKYLFRDWLRFLSENSKTYKHKDREKIASWWLLSEQRLLEWASDFTMLHVEQKRLPHSTGDGSHREALAKGQAMIALQELISVLGNNINPEEYGEYFANLIRDVQELPRWGGAKTRKDMLQSYLVEKAKTYRTERTENNG